MQKYVRLLEHFNPEKLPLLFLSQYLSLSLFYIMNFFLSVPATVAGVFFVSCLVKAQVRSALNLCDGKIYFRKFFFSRLSLSFLLSIYWSLMNFCCLLLIVVGFFCSSCVRPSVRITKKKKVWEKFPLFFFLFLFWQKARFSFESDFPLWLCH